MVAARRERIKSKYLNVKISKWVGCGRFVVGVRGVPTGRLKWT